MTIPVMMTPVAVMRVVIPAWVVMVIDRRRRNHHRRGGPDGRGDIDGRRLINYLRCRIIHGRRAADNHRRRNGNRKAESNVDANACLSCGSGSY